MIGMSSRKATTGARGRSAKGQVKRGAKSAAKRARPKRAAATRAKAKPSPLDRLREICLALPEAHEAAAWGTATFRIQNKLFAMYAGADSHHGGGRPAVWINAKHVEQDLVVRARPDRYFKPPYVGPGGWIGAWLDRGPPWSEIIELLREGYRLRAPKKLAAQLGD